ncbi:hypothetical protein KR044_002854 [Drosophila immigrans]|nr:hypothetical protein KR044_002854 [Drosophila immigrans]
MSVPLTFLLLSGGIVSAGLARFTNIKCEVLDPSYCAYEKCDLKILGRGIVALNVQAKLLKGPFNNAKVNLSLWRKFNGFRPFMFNTTFDFCKFLRTPQQLSFTTIIYDIIAPKSNLNHTCPFKDEIVVRNLIFQEEYFKFLPLPSAEYQVQIMAATDNHWKTRISVNILIHEDLKKS